MSILKNMHKKLKFFKSKFIPIFLGLCVSATEGATSNLSSKCGVKKKNKENKRKPLENQAYLLSLIICMKER